MQNCLNHLEKKVHYIFNDTNHVVRIYVTGWFSLNLKTLLYIRSCCDIAIEMRGFRT